MSLISSVPEQKSISSSRILGGKVNFPLCLAPMVGLSHVVLRSVVREYLPQNAFTIWPTEMLNSRRLPNENFATTPETMKIENETGLVPQILGNEEKFIAPSVAKLIDWGAEGIDINMGCPVQKALRHNYGVALMGDANYAAEVVHMTVKNSSVPVSVKLRAVKSEKEFEGFEYLVKFVGGLKDAGASWICLHPRTAEQMRRGSADWSQIKALKQAVRLPVVGNGDIQIADDVIDMLRQTDCDLVMAGRALAARPWLLWQVGEKLGFANPVNKTGQAPKTPLEEGAEYGKCLLKFIDYSKMYFTEEQTLRKLKFYLRMTSVWLPFGQALISVVAKAKDLSQIETAIAIFFNQEIEMTARTDLRQ